MKQFIYFALLIFAFSSCDDDDNIEPVNLPIAAIEFIETHFIGISIAIAEKERNPEHYDVTLVNGADIEFDTNGNWLSIDCENSFMPVPEGIILTLPVAINDYLVKNHPASKVVEIEKIIGGYEIDINGIRGELRFSYSGEFISYF